MPKTIVIFCRHLQADKMPFRSDYYWHAYIDLLLALKQYGASAYFATDNTTYQGQGVFSVAYTTDQKLPVSEFRRVENITADLVYDKGEFIRADTLPVLNPTFVHAITSNKTETYKHFARYQPLSFLCTSSDHLTSAIQALPSALVVAKTPTGNGGYGVHIATKEQMLHFKPRVYPVIIQEFIDTSVGIKGFVEGYHDLRIKIGGGEIWGGTLRTPRAGEYRANVSQGGTEKHLLPSQIPEQAKSLALEIDAFFANYPRYYAIDLAHTTRGWKLIELNSKPGLSPVHLSPQAKDITDKLAYYLVSFTDSTPL